MKSINSSICTPHNKLRLWVQIIFTLQLPRLHLVQVHLSNDLHIKLLKRNLLFQVVMEQFFISRVEPEPWRHTTRRCSHHHATSTTVWMMSWKKYQSLLLTSSFRDDTNSLNVRVYKCVNSNHFLRPRGLNTTMIVNGELLVWWCEKSWRPITTPAGMAKDIVKGKHEDLDHSLYLTKFFFFFLLWFYSRMVSYLHMLLWSVVTPFLNFICRFTTYMHCQIN